MMLSHAAGVLERHRIPDPTGHDLTHEHFHSHLLTLSTVLTLKSKYSFHWTLN